MEQEILKNSLGAISNATAAPPAPPPPPRRPSLKKKKSLFRSGNAQNRGWAGAAKGAVMGGENS